MLMPSRSGQEVVAGRDGEEIQDIGTNTSKKGNGFLGGERGKRWTSLSKFNDMAVIFRR